MKALTHCTVAWSVAAVTFVIHLIVANPLASIPAVILLIFPVRYWASGTEHFRQVPDGKTHRSDAEIESEIYGRPLTQIDRPSFFYVGATGLFFGTFTYAFAYGLTQGGAQ